MELVKSVSFENVVNQRNSMLALLEQAKALFDQANAIGVSLGIKGVPTGYFYSKQSEVDISYSDYIPTVRGAIDAKLWDKLMRESGLRTFMNAKARDAWANQIAEQKTPLLEVENIVDTFSNLYATRGRMFEDGVVDVFRSLSWNYKTNNPCRFGKRVILRCCGDLGWSMRSDAANKLDDLERVFCLVEGRPEPDHRNAWGLRMSGRVIEASSDYMSVRRYQNGNAHITFLKPDLVERLNEIVAKRFPGALAARV